MGNIRSRIIRKVRMFNIEARTEKILEKEKPKPAPRFPATEKQLQVAEELNPNFLKEHYSKDPNLNKRLKEVYVSSQDQTIERQESSRPLPVNRTEVKSPEYGVYEPTHIPPGKCSLRQAVTFLYDYKVDRVNNSVERIAEKFALDQQVVGNIVKHYQIMTLHLPEALNELKSEIASVSPNTKEFSHYAGLKELVDRFQEKQKSQEDQNKDGKDGDKKDDKIK